MICSQCRKTMKSEEHHLKMCFKCMVKKGKIESSCITVQKSKIETLIKDLNRLNRLDRQRIDIVIERLQELLKK